MTILRRAVTLLGLLYLGYRITMTGAGAEPVLFVLLLGAEAFGVFRFALEGALVRAPRPAMRHVDRHATLPADVLVVVGDESPADVRAAVLAASLVEGRESLCVVDVHDRPAVARLCQRLDVPRFAGVLEADRGALLDTAISLCGAPFTLIVPADVVVMPDVLSASLDSFLDSSVAVALPRIEEANALGPIDHLGYGEGWVRNEFVIGGLGEADALPWWSELAVVRRAALDSVDGMARGDDTTLATGVRLRGAGWRVEDVSTVAGRRLAAGTDDEHLLRWARDLHRRLGALAHRDVRSNRGALPRLGRWAMRGADVDVARAWQRITLVMVLFATLYTSALPLVADATTVMVMGAGWYGMAALTRRLTYGSADYQPWMMNDLRVLVTSVLVSWDVARGRPVPLREPGSAPGRRIRTVLLGGLHAALAASLVVFGTGILRAPHGDFATLVTLGLTAWLLAVVANARSAVNRQQMRQGYRTAEELQVTSAAGDLRVVGVSPFGLDVVSARQLALGAALELTLELPRPNGLTLPVDVSAVVMRTSSEAGRGVAYLRFVQLDDARMDRITEYVAVVGGQRALRVGTRPDRALVPSVPSIR
ncbi:MAG: hypothetical protein AAGC53_17820 [Actinomycetota bacterium]